MVFLFFGKHKMVFQYLKHKDGVYIFFFCKNKGFKEFFPGKGHDYSEHIYVAQVKKMN
jgi:hypothetical protein